MEIGNAKVVKRLIIISGLATMFLIFLVQIWGKSYNSLEILKVQEQAATQVLAVNGLVKAQTSVSLGSVVVGRVLSVHADEGDSVNQGELLVQIDSALAHSKVEQAQAAMAAQQVKQRQATVNAARAKALGPNATEARREEADLNVEANTSETARLKAALKQAQHELDQHKVLAPINGVVLSRNVEPGQIVTTQTELFEIANTDELIVEVDVDEVYSEHVQIGQKAVLSPVGSSAQLHGYINFLAPSVNTSTGGRLVKIAFDQPIFLPVGQTVNVNIIVNEFEKALSIPRRAIMREGAEKFIYVNDGGVAAKRLITFEDWPSDQLVVTEGLAVGDIVILNTDGISPGDAISAGKK